MLLLHTINDVDQLYTKCKLLSLNKQILRDGATSTRYLSTARSL